MKTISIRFFFRALIADIPLEEIVDELRDFDEALRAIVEKHLSIFGLWSILNLAVSLPGLFLSQGWLWYFFLMNCCWALINYGVLLFIFNHVYLYRFVTGNPFTRFRVQRHVEKMMLFNIGLDVAYIFAGLYFRQLSYTTDGIISTLWSGFGVSVIMQGTFLFCQDNVIHWLHYKNFYKARPFLEQTLDELIRERSTVDG